jgi:hypothetical protein
MLAQPKHTETETCTKNTDSCIQKAASSVGCRLSFNKAFFGKTTCLKVTQNNEGEIYFHFGLEQNKVWTWKKVKFSDTEIAQIIYVLEGKSQSISFFHNFNDDKTQIWITRKDNSVTFKTKHSSRTLIDGEILVLEILLKQFIINSCKSY